MRSLSDDLRGLECSSAPVISGRTDESAAMFDVKVSTVVSAELSAALLNEFITHADGSCVDRVLSGVYVFVCLFVCLSVCLFFLHMIPQDIATLSGVYVFVCLFVCLSVCFFST